MGDGFSAEKAGDKGWLLDSGATKSITGNINDFVEYNQWETGQMGYAYSDVHGKLTKSSGWGMLLIRAELPNGRINKVLVKGYLNTSIPIGNKLLSTEHLAEHYGMHYNSRTKKLENADGSIFACVSTASGTLYIIGPKRGVSYHKDAIGSESDVGIADHDVGKAFRNLKALEIHRCLGHAGKPKVAATMKDAELIQEGDTLEDQDFQCDACIKGKSTRQVSRTPQPRC